MNKKDKVVDQGQEKKPIEEGTEGVLSDYIEAIRNGDGIERAKKKLEEDIQSKVKSAIDKVYDNDRELLSEGMNEMTVNGRLAIYLNEEFKNYKRYHIDTEYYRLKVTPKEIKDLKSDRIRCDILLHSRRYYEDDVDNLLAIEVKLETSINDGHSDICRLTEFVEPKTPKTPKGAIHDTVVGLFIRFGEKGYNKVSIISNGYITKDEDTEVSTTDDS